MKGRGGAEGVRKLAVNRRTESVRCGFEQGVCGVSGGEHNGVQADADGLAARHKPAVLQ